MTISITPEQIVVGYILTTITHTLFWMTLKLIKLSMKRVDTQRRALIKHHVKEKHREKLGECSACAITGTEVLTGQLVSPELP